MPFDYKQTGLIAMIKRDLTRECPPLRGARSHLARLPVDVCGGNEQASPEAFTEAVITSSSSAAATASILTLLTRLISANLNK